MLHLLPILEVLLVLRRLHLLDVTCKEIFQQSAFYTSGILAADARLNNTIGTRVELPFCPQLHRGAR